MRTLFIIVVGLVVGTSVQGQITGLTYDPLKSGSGVMVSSTHWKVNPLGSYEDGVYRNVRGVDGELLNKVSLRKYGVGMAWKVEDKDVLVDDCEYQNRKLFVNTVICWNDYSHKTKASDWSVELGLTQTFGWFSVGFMVDPVNRQGKMLIGINYNF